MACGKTVHTKENAANILYRVKHLHNNRMGDKITKRMYYCHECSGWHLTSMNSTEFFRTKKNKNDKFL